ncbi:MAG TPA: hypothetical protein VIH90_04105 [Candidatus Saccharimonadales bacterium]
MFGNTTPQEKQTSTVVVGVNERVRVIGIRPPMTTEERHYLGCTGVLNGGLVRPREDSDGPYDLVQVPTAGQDAIKYGKEIVRGLEALGRTSIDFQETAVYIESEAVSPFQASVQASS